MDIVENSSAGEETILEGTRFVRACLRKPVDRTPVWFLRQAGRYMQEYRDVRKHHTLVEICKQPQLASLLQHVGDDGRSAFYEGPGAQAIANAVRALGGTGSVRSIAPLARL